METSQYSETLVNSENRGEKKVTKGLKKNKIKP